MQRFLRRLVVGKNRDKEPVKLTQRAEYRTLERLPRTNWLDLVPQTLSPENEITFTKYIGLIIQKPADEQTLTKRRSLRTFNFLEKRSDRVKLAYAVHLQVASVHSFILRSFKV